MHFSLPTGDHFARTAVRHPLVKQLHPIFHDPVKRAEHIASLMPDGKQLKTSILDVLKTEHETELTIDAKNRKFDADLKAKYGMDLPGFNLHMIEQIQNKMNASKEAKKADEALLFSPSDKDLSMIHELHGYSEECAQLNAKTIQKRLDFEKTLSPVALRIWKDAYSFSGPASPVSVRESTGYLVDALMNRDLLSQKQQNTLHVPDKEILLQNTEQYLALRRDLGNQFLNTLDPVSKANFAKLVLGVQYGPNTLAEQVKFIQRRLPSQASPEKEAALTEHVRKTLKLMRGTSVQIASPLLSAVLCTLSKTKEQITETSLFPGVTSSLSEQASNLLESHQFASSLDPQTRIALGKSISSLNLPMMAKPISLVSRLAEVID